MSSPSLNHIEEGYRVVERLKTEGLHDLAEQNFKAIRFSFTGLELAYSMLNALESAKESGSVRDTNTISLIDSLIVDLRQKLGIS